MHRFIVRPVVAWLLAALVVVGGCALPSAASAHPGHDAERLGHGYSVQGTGVFAGEARFSGAALRPDVCAMGHDPERRAGCVAADVPPSRGTACGGAVCCGVGHGCCAATLPAGVGLALPDRRVHLRPVTRLHPPGLALSAPREPPRPVF